MSHDSNQGGAPERPPSLDTEGHKLAIHPSSVKGFYRNLRNLVYSVLILIFLVLPWTHFSGKQTILLNIIDRKFIFFGQTFLAHDGPLIFFLISIAAFSILFVTAVWGRLWCGWACPQTVFIDFIFRKTEEWIEGNYIQRRKLNDAKMGYEESF